MKTKCWCDGVEREEGSRHYPSGNPENGPSHLAFEREPGTVWSLLFLEWDLINDDPASAADSPPLHYWPTKEAAKAAAERYLREESAAEGQWVPEVLTWEAETGNGWPQGGEWVEIEERDEVGTANPGPRMVRMTIRVYPITPATD